MSKNDFCAVVQHALAESASFVDGEMSQERAKATEYYLGKPFGNEEEGRSQVILTEVRDAVDGMLPSLLRVMFGAEHAVEFVPTRADNVEQAAQKTDYVRYVFEEDNAGFLKALEVLKDGLVRKIGIFKWAWDTSVSVRAYRMEGVSKAQLDQIAADDTIDMKHIAERIDPEVGTVYDVDLTKTRDEGRAVIWAVPPEELLYNRTARTLDDALLLFHRTEKTRGELLAMGISEKDLDAHGGAGTSLALASNAEAIARTDASFNGKTMGSGIQRDPEMGKGNDKILYSDGVMRVDYDGDGIPELRRVCCIGPQFYPVKHYPADDSMGFAIFTPYPEPHTLVGGSVADRTMDVQKINSSLLRGTLDSLSASIFPRTVALEGGANMADIMNTAIGAPIRERVQNAVRILETPFVGKEALPILGFMQEVVERRTGRNKGTAGLDADALQSTGKEAVGAVLTGSQEQLEMLARVFAEMTLKPLFAGLGRLLQTKQPRERVVRLRGQWVEVDPRSWNANMDVTVNVGLGTTFTDKKIATLMAVAADQEHLLQQFGLSGPLVSLPMFRNTRAKILSLQGLKDVDSYYKPLPPNWEPPAPPPPQPDAEQAWIQAEKEMNHQKTMKELAIKADELALKTRQLEVDRELKILNITTTAALKRYEIEATTGHEREQNDLQREVDQEIAHAELVVEAQGQLHQQDMDRAAMAHTQTIDHRTADIAQQNVDQQGEQPEPTTDGGEA